MARFSFRGPIAPVFSPFNHDNARSLNVNVVPKYAKFLADNGVKGVLVNGTTGEGMLQSVRDRKVLIEKWMETKKTTNQHVMVQVGGAPLPDVLKLAKHAESIGVDSILCLPELYYKPSTPAELINYLKMVGEAAPNTPLLYYHIPMFTNVNIHMGQFLREIDDKIPTFTGIKFTSEALDEGLEAVNAHNKRFSVFLGTEWLMARAYKMGFVSTITTSLNFLPQFAVKIHEHAFNGEHDEAERLQEQITTIVKVVTQYGRFKTQSVKEAMNLFTPCDVGPPKHPMIRLSLEEIRSMEESVKGLKII
ncbi:dihydrodipicolinate synthase [Holotrichia oblita]|uniref:Dihydrodipicolinate synthase n=1 Tax=Holotrichia oblita TaxID=644536 RepID=A0ACB9TJH3_HOLOL|nr:dihydrodipicolinate synthase [Holotrichia oblita]